MNQEQIEHELSDIRRRLEQLESGNFGRATIKCGNLGVNDSLGRVRILLRVSEEGDPMIGLMDADSTPKVFIDAADGDPGIVLSGKTGEIVAQLGVSEDGSGELRIESNDKSGLVRIGNSRLQEHNTFGITLVHGVEYRIGLHIMDSEPQLVINGLTDNTITISSSNNITGISWNDNQGNITRVISDDD